MQVKDSNSLQAQNIGESEVSNAQDTSDTLTQDVNMSYVQVMHDYYNQCYNTRTEEYMVALEKSSRTIEK